MEPYHTILQYLRYQKYNMRTLVAVSGEGVSRSQALVCVKRRSGTHQNGMRNRAKSVKSTVAFFMKKRGKEQLICIEVNFHKHCMVCVNGLICTAVYAPKWHAEQCKICQINCNLFYGEKRKGTTRMLESKFSLETFLPFRNLTKNGIFSVNLFFTPHPFRILTEESTSRFY